VTVHSYHKVLYFPHVSLITGLRAPEMQVPSPSVGINPYIAEVKKPPKGPELLESILEQLV
jgi:hypothetical protein